jgi:hypothetical protein
MSFTDFRKNATQRLVRVIVAAASVVTLATGAAFVSSPAAFADDGPTTAQLLQSCDWADYCQFHPQSYTTYIGPSHQVGPLVYNCGSLTNSQTISWSDTTGSTNSVGVAITASYKFSEVFEASIQVSYEHTWSTSHTDSQSDTVNVPSKYAGWMVRGTAKQKATGWYELHYGKPYYGHYIWYVYNYTESGFDTDNPNAGYVTFHDRAMTSSERSQNHC